MNGMSVAEGRRKLVEVIGDQLRRCFTVPGDAADKLQGLNVVLEVRLHWDGRLASPPVAVEPTRVGEIYRSLKAAAVEAVQRCSPLALPPQLADLVPFDQWRVLRISFQANDTEWENARRLDVPDHKYTWDMTWHAIHPKLMNFGRDGSDMLIASVECVDGNPKLRWLVATPETFIRRLKTGTITVRSGNVEERQDATYRSRPVQPNEEYVPMYDVDVWTDLRRDGLFVRAMLEDKPFWLTLGGWSQGFSAGRGGVSAMRELLDQCRPNPTKTSKWN